ncbi:nucleotide exchange factor GrpE [Falsiroseomonas tokyonensis]|uniref:Protein GrpE n=1 Tax=Falsiroseomonas tokyonensis TaxID=430521 RepID=A0ABV7BSQ4_9PROT|nr:nucleotide exchange factor GrpE [Falsiroseomonas tokyonensis]
MSDTQDTPTPAENAAAANPSTGQTTDHAKGADASAQPGAETPPMTEAERIAALEAEVIQMRDKWLRSEAEMQNLRARTKRETEDARLYAVQKFARDVVETAENLRRGLDSLPPAAEDEPELLGKLRGGFEGVERAFVTMLERHGIARVEAQGKTFDPELHQAMAEQPAPEGTEPGTIIQAWTPAWTLHGRLLKPAMVVVAGK